MTGSQLGEAIQIIGVLIDAGVFLKIIRDGRFRNLRGKQFQDLRTWFNWFFPTKSLKVLFVTGFALTLLGAAIKAWL